MSNAAVAAHHPGTIAAPALILAGLLALMGVQTNLITIPTFGPSMTGPETVLIASRPFDFRAGGDYVSGNAPSDSPMVHVEQPPPLEIMKYQVSAADYAQCVTDGACEKAQPRRRGKGNVPATGVSYDDAIDYAAWLSKQTGATWRLPTIEEWTFAAGSKAVDPALGVKTDTSDPAERWLLTYDRETALGNNGPAKPEPLGAFGVNEYGVADLSAVVWEWSATCASRTTRNDAGNVLTQVESCGVRYLEGRHRTPMSTFVRDAVGGGCSVGIPPDNFGFRLVREPGWIERAGNLVAAWLKHAN